MAGTGTDIAVTVGVIAVVTPLVLRFLSSGKVEGAVGQVRYSGRARALALCLGLLPLTGITVGLVVQKRPLRPDEYLPVTLIYVLFAAITLPLVVEFFGLKHTFDERGWDYNSPWSKHRRVEWADVELVRWRPAMKWLDFHPRDAKSVLHISPMTGGLEGFARTALRRLPGGVLEQSPEVHAVLQLMAHGHASSLLMASELPTVLAARLLPGEPLGQA